MGKFQQILAEPLFIIAVAAMVVMLLARFGCLGRRSLWVGPSRAVGLGLVDVVVGFSLMAAGIVGLQLVAPWLMEVDAQTGKPAPATLLREVLMVPLSQLFLFGPPVLYFVARAAATPHGLVKVGVLPRKPGAELLRGAVGLLVIIPIVLGLLVLAKVVGILVDSPPPDLGHDLLRYFRQPEAQVERIILGLTVIALGPILEEALYRGFLQSALVEALGRRRRWGVVVGVSALFAVMHMGSVPPHALPALWALGIGLGWLYERTGSLWPSILVHAGFNAMNVALTLLQTMPEPTREPIVV